MWTELKTFVFLSREGGRRMKWVNRLVHVTNMMNDGDFIALGYVTGAAVSSLDFLLRDLNANLISYPAMVIYGFFLIASNLMECSARWWNRSNWVHATGKDLVWRSFQEMLLLFMLCRKTSRASYLSHSDADKRPCCRRSKATDRRTRHLHELELPSDLFWPKAAWRLSTSNASAGFAQCCFSEWSVCVKKPAGFLLCC